MLSTLTTLKARLAIEEFNVEFDSLLTNALDAISARFDKECNRTFARAENITHEFAGDDLEVMPQCYPIETVTKFELKENETDGWVEQTNVVFLVRRGCIVSLQTPLSTLRSSFCVARLTYTGGYVLPGTDAADGQTILPPDLEQAAIEQVTSWFQNRDKLGLDTVWFHGGVYEKFSKLDLLLPVRAALRKYERWSI
jgi:hypothetical protein